ncbi:hypothetical protein [Hyphococcus sp.]|uniref:hypothetical protein n=1 Tax=Hyphococcus sp. TaxID=2038636 RepID=UPI0020875542|nr:MAG: hypothetical protein DHS20C04_18490 [Marinicaulis sp.]
MPGAPSGFLGKLSADRPMLAAAIVAVGLTSLCVLGVRNSADPASSNLILRFVLAASAVLCAPMAIAAMTPQRLMLRTIFIAVVVALGAAIIAAAFGKLDLGGMTPPKTASGTGLGLFLFFAALSPLTRSTLRLGGVGPIAAVIGAAGGIGYFALDGLLMSPFSGAAAAITLTAGVCIGAGVGADYAQHFARGLTPRSAAAAAGHSAIAPAAFSILAVAACMLIVTFNANFGAVDWRVLAAAGAAVLLSCATAMIFATSALSLFRPNEQAAVDENRRRQRFAESWRPVRRRLPATTAAAASAIVGVLIVIALFEVGLPEAVSLGVFLVLILIASGLTFVSFRTSILIAALLFTSTVFTGYIYAVLGMTAPAMMERFTALTLSAIAFSQLTVSWRNAGDIWRNARDIAQNAMSDGLRRFAIAIGAGSAATVASAYAFTWEAGVSAAAYFAIVAGVGLFLAPFLMVALSTQFQRY